MKATSCIAWGIHLSESKNLFTNHTHRRFATTVVAELLGVLLLWNTECAGASAGSIMAAGTPRLPDQVRLNLGTIGIMQDGTPATCRFATGAGVVESRGERVARLLSNLATLQRRFPGQASSIHGVHHHRSHVPEGSATARRF